MGGFGALDLGRQEPKRFCAVGGHSPAVFARGSHDIEFGFDDAADFAKHDLLRIARDHSPYGGAGLDRHRRTGRAPPRGLAGSRGS